MAYVVLGAAPVVAQENSDYPDVPSDVYYTAAVQELAEKGVFTGTDCAEGFCPDDPIDRATMAVWTVRVLDGSDPLPVTATRFTDVDASHRYAAFIERFAELGVTQGCGDGTEFCPDGTVIRAEMAVFLVRALDLDEGPDPGFDDVPFDAWYASEVAGLVASGITSGCGDGSVFCPGRATQRAQMAAFLHRAINRNVDHPGPPLVAIESPAPLVTSGNFEVTLRFSKPVSGLSRSEIVVVNGQAGSLAGSGSRYTSRIEPAADGIVMVWLPAGAVKSSDGNPNEASAALIRTIAPAARADVPGLDTWNRPLVLTSANQEFNRSEPDWGFTGDVSRCVAGTTSQAFRDSVIQRVNWYRQMAGLDTVIEDPDLSASAQRAALMMAAQEDLSHYPDSDWACYSDDGAAAAGKSNLWHGYGYGPGTTVGVSGIDGYMQDAGDNNRSVGHRRWILYPHTLEMGTGNAGRPGRSGSNANALDVVSGDRHASRPDVREERGFVSWPSSGYVPANVVWGRWSFSLAGADFSNARVGVADRSGEVRVKILDRGAGIVWAVAGTTNSQLLRAPRNGDHCYIVTVSGVRIGDEVQRPYEYRVCVIDPKAPAGPSVAITSASPDKVNEEFDVKITFSEPVTGFGRNEIFVVNGSVSAFVGWGREYTATIAPHGGGNISVQVGAGVIHNEQRLPNSPSALSRQTDIGRPSVTMTSNAPPTVSGSFDVLIAFSEPVTATQSGGRVIDRLSVVNGQVLYRRCKQLSETWDGFRECTASILPEDYGEIIVTVDSGAAYNSGGQASMASEPLTRVSDVSFIGPPTASLSSPAPAVVSGSFDVLIAFSEPVTGIWSDKPLIDQFSVENGRVLDVYCAPLSGSHDFYEKCTASISLDDYGVVVVTLNAGAVHDAERKPNRASEPLIRESNVSFAGPPTVSLSSQAPPVVYDWFVVMITFSELVTATQSEMSVIDQLSVVNGRVLDGYCTFGPDTFPEFQQCSARILPDDYGDVVVTVNAAVFQDDHGEPNRTSEPLIRESAVSPAGPPSVMLSSSAPPIVDGGYDVVISFSEPVTGLDSWCEDPDGDENECPLRVLNGIVLYLMCDALPEFRTCIVTILPNGIGEVTMTVHPGAVRDRNGETNTFSVSLVRESQVARPTVVISSNAPRVVTGSFDIRITFSEAVSGFEQRDIEVINGTVTRFSGSGNEYTATIVVEIDEPDPPLVVVRIRDGAAHDRLNRPNQESEVLHRLLTESPRRN